MDAALTILFVLTIILFGIGAVRYLVTAGWFIIGVIVWTTLRLLGKDANAFGERWDRVGH